jgi:hypothetical protein
MRVLVPLRGLTKDILNLINWKVFDVSRLLFHEYRIVVRRGEVEEESVKPYFRNRPLVKAVVVMTIFAAAIYKGAFGLLVPRHFESYELHPRSWVDSFALLLHYPASLTFDLLVFVAVMGLIVWLAATESLPVAQGYRRYKNILAAEITEKASGGERPLAEDGDLE